MITIPVTVTGDHWLNPEQVRTALTLSDPAETLVLDLSGEGPSLHRLGVIDTLAAHCADQHRDADTVLIARWSNAVETVPYQRRGRTAISHFFWLSDRYWPGATIPCAQGHLWGFFMGRPTVPRLLLLRDLAQGDQALLSMMQGGAVPDAAQGVLVDTEEFGLQPDLTAWYHACSIASLDRACIRDQYRADKNTNLALLAHYDQFHIEVVAESYVYGDTFFPTEKTLRPLAAGKPIIVMGPRGFLRRLQDLGFRTWANLWDETYDDLEGPARLSAIQHVIQSVQQQCALVLRHVAQHAEHNRRTMAEIAEKHRPGP